MPTKLAFLICGTGEVGARHVTGTWQKREGGAKSDMHFAVLGGCWLGGALAGKRNLLYGLGPNPVAGERFVYTSRFPVIFPNSQNCRQITATPRGVFSMLPNPSKCHIRPKINKNTYFHNKIKNPLELRLA